jgi:hypothetical protein
MGSKNGGMKARTHTFGGGIMGHYLARKLLNLLAVEEGYGYFSVSAKNKSASKPGDKVLRIREM